mmetsp:Transcript_111349/g.294186  ORF Transcript_111349/g.294186 Transcript_111349/m.294186 type:complete len:262 (+) Transcript_111349:1322-2107(+)
MAHLFATKSFLRKLLRSAAIFSSKPSSTPSHCRRAAARPSAASPMGPSLSSARASTSAAGLFLLCVGSGFTRASAAAIPLSAPLMTTSSCFTFSASFPTTFWNAASLSRRSFRRFVSRSSSRAAPMCALTRGRPSSCTPLEPSLTIGDSTSVLNILLSTASGKSKPNSCLASFWTSFRESAPSPSESYRDNTAWSSVFSWSAAAFRFALSRAWGTEEAAASCFSLHALMRPTRSASSCCVAGPVSGGAASPGGLIGPGEAA